MTHMERFKAATAHIKAGEINKAMALYDDPEALASDGRVIERKCKEAEDAIRHRGNSD